ncbi:MAG: hypothetical protein R2746_06675 [Acidimicrobiales bacterium]
MEQQVRWQVRPAEERDVEAIAELVRELAAYEREPEAALASGDDFRAALFGPAPSCTPTWPRWPTAPATDRGRWWGSPCGSPRSPRGRAATASGWRTCSCAPSTADSGWAERCCPPWPRSAWRGWPRFEWWVLDWNEPAHRFYESLGAQPQDEWTTWRLDGEALAEAAARVLR